MNEFVLLEITRSELPESMQTVLGSADSGRLLKFQNAVLARAEINRNGDELTETGLQEVAATLPHTAIDIEHKHRDVCGYYIDARVVPDPTLDNIPTLYTDGFIFADRYPEIADGIRSTPPRYKQSIEAVASECECSICGNVFARESQYCNHLRAKRESGAVRKLRGMKARGGAVTTNPAGTNTVFNEIAMVASLEQDEAKATEPDTKTVLKTLLQSSVAKPEQFDLSAAAQRVIAAINSDLIALNPTGQVTLMSPVLYPFYYIPPTQNTAAPEKPNTEATNKLQSELVSAQAKLDAQAKQIEELAGKVNALEARGQETEKPKFQKARLGVAGIVLESKQEETSQFRVVPK